MIQLKFIVNFVSCDGKYAHKKALFNKFKNEMPPFVLLQIAGVESGNNFAVVREQTTWDAFRLWKDNMRDGNTRWRSWLRQRKVAASIPDGVIGIFFTDWSFRPHYVPGVGSASNITEYLSRSAQGLLFTCNMRVLCGERCTELNSSRMAVKGNISLTFGFHNNKNLLDWLRKSTVPMFRLSSHSEARAG